MNYNSIITELNELNLNLNIDDSKILKKIQIYKNFDFNKLHNKITKDIDSSIIKKQITNSKDIFLLDNYIILYKFYDNNIFTKELNILNFLINTKIVPEIYFTNNLHIYLKYFGNTINRYNLPNDWDKQIKNIFYIFTKNKIYHNNYTIENLFVFNDKIKLANFEVVDLQDYNPNLYIKLIDSLNNMFQNRNFSK